MCEPKMVEVMVPVLPSKQDRLDALIADVDTLDHGLDAVEARVRFLEDRIPSTLATIALTLSDFRDRLEALERPSRWTRLKAWLGTNVYSGGPIFTHTPYDERAL